jgi:ribosomal protein S30
MRLLRRPQLKDRDVWLLSSGPVGEHKARRLGGKVDEDAGSIRRKMARNMPPELRDRRDWEQIEQPST